MTEGPRHFDCLVVGAGFAGLYLLHRLRGLGLKALALEAGDDVGGTWYWNRYPGARCDVESFEYSYHFSPELEQEWNWSERYATQPEILRYAEHVTERFDLRRDIQFNCRVTAARFDEGKELWRVDSAEGESFSAPFLIMATGCLSVANIPSFPGDQDFRGQIFHTGRWPKERVDFTGLKVGVIGTGSSAIQSIPLIAQEASQLTVFQRTANYIVPAHNRHWNKAEREAIKANYGELRERAIKTFNAIDTRFNPAPVASVSPEDFARMMEERWQAGGLPFLAAFGDILRNAEANQAVAQFVRGKIGEIVKDPKIADLLTPDFAIGCKRLCVDSGYWETFNRPTVELVDVKRTPIVTLTPEGLRTKGRAFQFDAIVFATGFDAMTGALTAIDIQGRGGQRLKDKWAAGPRAYLGLGVAGFPNLFTVTGPGCPAVLTNVLMSIEHHVDWIATCLERMRDRGQRVIEVEEAAEDAWGAEVAESASSSLRLGCNSWYLGANVTGKPRVYMPYAGGFPAYCERVTEITKAGYRGFNLA